MKRTGLGYTFGLVAVAMLGISPSAEAVFLSNGDAVGSAYTIQNISPGLTIDFTTHTPAPANANTIGELTMFASHSSFVWLGFDLLENAPAAADSGENGGLRVLLDVRDTNAFSPVMGWRDYHIRAVDHTPIDFSGLPPDERPNENFHKTIAHFHDSAPGYDSAPLSQQGNHNNVVRLDFGLPAPVPQGVEFTVNDILIHERDFAGHQRSFRVETIPTPEPTTFALVTLGMLGLVAFARRRRPVALR